MTFTLGLAQTRLSDNSMVQEDIESFCHQADEQGVDLLAFPESLMTPFELSVDDFVAAAQPHEGEFASFMNALAREYGLWILYTMNESDPDHGLPFNTAVIVDPDGVPRVRYRKTHLFDSSTHRESSKMTAGDEIAPVIETRSCKIGLGICYDLRFPEYARSLALEGCDLIIYPAAWVDGPRKLLQWRTLLCARAVENELFVAGLSRAAEGYVGESFVFAPDGDEIACSKPRERDLVIADIDLERIAEMRGSIPSLEHRRPELYTGLTE